MWKRSNEWNSRCESQKEISVTNISWQFLCDSPTHRPHFILRYWCENFQTLNKHVHESAEILHHVLNKHDMIGFQHNFLNQTCHIMLYCILHGYDRLLDLNVTTISLYSEILKVKSPRNIHSQLICIYRNKMTGKSSPGSCSSVPAAYRRGRRIKWERHTHPAAQQRETSQP